MDSRNVDEVGKTNHELCETAAAESKAGRHSPELDKAIKDYDRTGKMSCNEGWDAPGFAEKAAAAAQNRLAQQAVKATAGKLIQTKLTIQVGVTINVSVGPIAVSLQSGIAIDAQGNLGSYGSVGLGTGVGAQVAAGVSVEASNAASISDLSGPFNNVSAGGFDGVGATVDGFTGPSSNGTVTGGGFTAGVGLGGSASTGGSYTSIDKWNQ